MKSKIMAIVTLLVMLLMSSCGESKLRTPVPQISSNDYKEVTESDMTLKWKVDGANLKVIFRAPTTGWVAVGFQPVYMMHEADIFIGYVKDGQVFIRNDYGVEDTAHTPNIEAGGKDNASDKSGKEADGYTEISFTMPLNSNDGKHPALVPGKAYTVLTAYGPNDADNFKTRHKNKVRVQITL